MIRHLHGAGIGGKALGNRKQGYRRKTGSNIDRRRDERYEEGQSREGWKRRW